MDFYIVRGAYKAEEKKYIEISSCFSLECMSFINNLIEFEY